MWVKDGGSEVLMLRLHMEEVLVLKSKGIILRKYGFHSSLIKL